MLDSLLLAAAATDWSQYLMAAKTIAITAAVIGLPFVVGWLLEQSLRMPGYGVKIGYSLAAISISIAVIIAYRPAKLGVDLKGGTILIYSIDAKATEAMTQTNNRGGFNMEALCQALTMRVNPDGLKEIVIRPFGENQVEVIVPETGLEVDALKEKLEQPGFLEFRIVADPQEDGQLVNLAMEQTRSPDIGIRRSRFVVGKDEEGKNRNVAFWAGLKRDAADEETKKAGQYKWRGGFEYVVRDGTTGELLTPDVKRTIEILNGKEKGIELENFLVENKIVPEVLMRIDPEYAVTGDDLAGTDRHLGINGYEIHFTVKSGEPSSRMGQMTGRNLRAEPRKPRLMAIILDGDVISAPAIRGRITDRGQITGNFTEKEVNFIVEILRAGQLPAILEKQPASENKIGATLGDITIKKGMWSTGISLAVIMIFMLVYYRFAGMVANVALIMNLLLTVALMMLFRAPFTLPGLAGLVLTMGMAVDANVLIFERIREELQKGAALRMAIRNGFDRALVTIIDSNLTTLFTAVVLYLRGTDQVRGFATTLTLGLCTSMFTACYVARVIFDIFERNRWIKSLNMMKMFTVTHIAFSRLMVPALAFSAIFMAVGAAALFARGRSLFDIDLAGGTKAIWSFTEKIPEDEVRSKLSAAFADLKDESGAKVSWTLTTTTLPDVEAGQSYDLTNSIQDEKRLQEIVYQTFPTKFQTYSMEIAGLTEVKTARPVETPLEIKPVVNTPPTPDTPASDTPPANPSTEPPANTTPDTPKPDEKPVEGDKKQGDKSEPESPASAKAEGEGSGCQAPEEAAAQPAGKDEPEQAKPEPAEPKTPEPKTEPAAEPNQEPDPKQEPAPETPATEPGDAPKVPTDLKPEVEQKVVSSSTEATLKFPSASISAEALIGRIRKTSKQVFGENMAPAVRVIEGDGKDVTDLSAKRHEWKVQLGLEKARTSEILNALQQKLNGEPVFESINKIGTQVAGDSQRNAIQAIIISLLMIMAYIWLRFHKLSWGIAAVAALVHDTLIMLGAVAISTWIAPALGFAMVEEFRISLTVIAAFLTLIGFSINDTIVIFDRIREIRGKNPDLTVQMVDDSINQTLSRTILTSGTVFMVLVVLYIGGGPGVHAFSYSLLVGVISGTYSTVFIAAPLLLWMLGKRGKKGLFGGA